MNDMTGGTSSKINLSRKSLYELFKKWKKLAKINIYKSETCERFMYNKARFDTLHDVVKAFED